SSPGGARSTREEDITMRRQRHAGGRLYKRKSRCTGKELSTWTMVFLVDGTEKRESTGETDFEAAQERLRKRLFEVDEGTYTAPHRERLTVADILDRVRGHYALKGHRSGDTLKAHIATWTTALGASRRALAVTTQMVQRVLEQWRARGDSPATCNRRLAILRRAYRLAKLRLDPARLDFVD